jgi:hypothetical protein
VVKGAKPVLDVEGEGDEMRGRRDGSGQPGNATVEVEAREVRYAERRTNVFGSGTSALYNFSSAMEKKKVQKTGITYKLDSDPCPPGPVSFPVRVQ